MQMANAARNGQSAGRDMGFEEAEIKRKMSEIADWLKSQAEPPPPPPAPKLHVVSPAPVQDEDSLDGIIQRRMAARQERGEIGPDSGSLREVMGRFSGPIHAEADPERRGALNAAVAEIMQRQRRLEEDVPNARYDTDMETAFERLAEQFERRAARTFDTLESSLAEVSGLVRNARSPSEDVHLRIEDLARELTELRADATDSERRTRELLDVVRQTLEHVAARLPERAAAPPPVEASPSIRARAAAMRAQQESGVSEDFDLAAHATPERRQFIAAARRAKAPEPAAKYRVQNAQRASYPIEAARPSTVKRTLLAGVAAAALLCGIYAGSSRFLDGIFSGPEIASAPNDGAARTETAMPSAPTPAEAQVATTASAPPPAPMIAPQAPPPAPVEAASILAEPATTGSIPQFSEPAPDPLPVEIGGPRLRTRAVAGDANAQYEVAMRFAEGRGVARDVEKAAIWMARAASQGLAPAQYRLGSLTEKGTGVTKDVQAARRLYEQAAGAGNVQAMHNLGVLHAEGGLGAPDMAVALVWFRKAADYGVKDSQYNLGIFYARGLSVPQDLSQSYLWFSLAAAQGDKEAASKRDQIAAKLGADKVQAVKIKADTWKPKAAPIEANEVAPPPEGWDTPANQARAN
jgi:localization factor PodJL